MSLTGPQALQLLTTTTKPLAGQHVPEWQSAWTSLDQYFPPAWERPAILAIEWRVGRDDDKSFNQSHTDAARDHIQRGGIVGIAPHFPSPFSSDQTISSTWGTKGDHALLLQGAPSSTAKSRWQGNIDRLNVLFDALGADAPVIFHPFHEANGSHFWWGYNSSNPSKSSVGAANLYNDLMNRTSVVDRGYIRGFHTGMDWYANASFGMPGLSNFDVAGSSLYRISNTPLEFPNKFGSHWQNIKNFGKPCLIFEGGPSQVEQPYATASWDAQQLSEKLLIKYPETKSTIAWHRDARGFGPWNSFSNGVTAYNSPFLARLPDIQQVTPPNEPGPSTVFTALRNPVVGVYTSEQAAWAAGDDVIAVVQSDIQEA